MDGRRLGRILRAVRLHKRLRQVDVGRLAVVSQSVVSRVERGRLAEVSFEHVDRVSRALGVTVYLDAKWEGGDVDRLVDRTHASIVEQVVDLLVADGWEVVAEYGFNHFGDRGSVDVLAWHAASRTLLIVEVKSRITDLQAALLSFATKVRVVPRLVREERGWDSRWIGRLFVLPGTSANRAIVARHQATFDATFPERMPAIRAWLRRPDRSLGGVWFLSSMLSSTRKQVLRVRRRPSHRSACGGSECRTPA